MSRPILTTRNADAVRDILLERKNADFTPEYFGGATLPGLVELYRTIQDNSANAQLFWQGIADAAIQSPWKKVDACWRRERPNRIDSSTMDSGLGFFRIDTRAIGDRRSLSQLQYSEFQQGCVRIGKNLGWPQKYLTALMGVLVEMTLNIIEHSELEGAGKFTGLIGCQIERNYFSMIISDLGMGCLESLKTSPSWDHLHSDEEALHAIVDEHASRKTGMGGGEGFRQIFSSLIDHNSMIRIRSGSSCVELTQQPGSRDAAYRRSPFMRGCQITISTAISGNVEEKIILD
jgi:hypothetical protein